MSAIAITRQFAPNRVSVMLDNASIQPFSKGLGNRFETAPFHFEAVHRCSNFGNRLTQGAFVFARCSRGVRRSSRLRPTLPHLDPRQTFVVRSRRSDSSEYLIYDGRLAAVPTFVQSSDRLLKYQFTWLLLSVHERLSCNRRWRFSTHQRSRSHSSDRVS
jgi:hypothetical protein